MGLADFQNPIANSPHVTQSSGTQQQAVNSTPQTMSQEQQREDGEKAMQVDEAEEAEQRDAIRDDEERGQNAGSQARRRARKSKQEREPESEPRPVDDGIHGNRVDFRA